MGSSSTWLAGRLGPSRLAREGVMGLAAGDLGDSEEKERSAWSVCLVHRSFRA